MKLLKQPNINIINEKKLSLKQSDYYKGTQNYFR